MIAAVGSAAGKSVASFSRPARGQQQKGRPCCCFVDRSFLKHVESKAAPAKQNFRGRKGEVAMVAEMTR